MSRIRKKITPLALLLCTLLSTGCDGGYDCALDNIAYNRIKFYSINEYGAEAEYAFPEYLTASIMINGRDSIVVNHTTNAKELILPMSYTNVCDTVILNFFDRYNDTLYIGHENIPIYQSMECGVIMHHRLTEIAHTGNIIDSMAIKRAEINFNPNENIKLYFVE